MMDFDSGYRNFERCVGGFRPGELTVLAAPPTMGATAFCLGMMNNPDGKGNMLYLSLSATVDLMSIRLAGTGITATQDGHDPDLLRVGHMGREHLIMHRELPGTVGLLETMSRAATVHMPHLIIVNNLSSIGMQRRHIFDPDGAHHRILRLLKTMAVALQRPILLLATIISDSEQRRGLQFGAQAIREPHVDNIIVMHRYDYYDLHADDFDEPLQPGDTDLYLMKCRRLGGYFRLRFNRDTWLMEDIHELA